MTKKSILAVALTLALASATAATAATKQHQWTDTYNSTVYDPPADEMLFNRAKGGID